MGRDQGERYRAVVVENFEPRDRRALSPCAVARWELAQHTDITVMALDDGEGRRAAKAMKGQVFAYSDGRPQADLTHNDLLRVRAPQGQVGLYESLAALATAVALGMPLSQAAQRLSQS